MLIASLGRHPHKGEEIPLGPYLVTVDRLEGRRIARLIFRLATPTDKEKKR